MSFSERARRISLISAIAALGASVGAVSTAYAEPARLSNSQMDAITGSGNEICPDCFSGPAPMVDASILESGVLLIQWDLATFPAESSQYAKIPAHFIKEVTAKP